MAKLFAEDWGPAESQSDTSPTIPRLSQNASPEAQPPIPSGSLEAGVGIASSGTIPSYDPAPSQGHVRALFDAGRLERFEDGRESRFSQGLCRLVRTLGQDAVAEIAKLLSVPGRYDETLSEAMRWLGQLEDPRSQAGRLWLLEQALQHPAPKVRDGAALGLCSLGHPHAIPFLERAIEVEPGAELRGDLQQVLDELKDLTAGCPM